MDELNSRGATYRNAAVVALALCFGACSQAERMAAQPSPVARPSPALAADTGAADPVKPAGYDQIGIASWYGGRHQGRRTASGSRFDTQALTAAHRFLPFGTVVLVENLANGRRIELRITDRGPYVQGRIIDLSLAAAQHLGLDQQGVGLVGLTVLPPASPNLIAAGP